MTIFAIVQLEDALDRLERYVDEGDSLNAKKYQYQLESITNKIKNFCQERGGTLHLSVPNRIVFEVDAVSAEQIPMILESYIDSFEKHIAVGLGMDWQEAASAANKSKETHRLELFEPTGAYVQHVYKSESDFDLSPEVLAAYRKPDVNIYSDPTQPKPLIRENKQPLPQTPTLEESVRLEQENLAITLNSVGGMPPAPAPAPQPQAQPQMAPQDAEQQSQPQQGQPEESQGQPTEDKEQIPEDATAPDGRKYQLHEPEPEEKEEIEPDMVEGENDHNEDPQEEKIFEHLRRLKEELPEIMALKAKDPEAFKDAIKLIQMLISAAKQKQDVKKSERRQTELDELAKALVQRARPHTKTPRGLPVGTTWNRRKKVLINGKQIWRSVASGLTADSTGQPISVKSHNAAANKGINKSDEV